MLNAIKKFWNDEEGLGTLEILLIVAVLVGLAVLFRKRIIEWVNKVIGETGDYLEQDKKVEIK
ncbi:Flp1 family type IVb pilin [Caldalkalibacillus mannanilyticus]|uniref:Flp1 family type IVb pilin n=1 Tax=Caldalkalibacillus mannanilyticus TaxID=1418 RepID=UPI00054CD881|nr:Flp1 family type IVb pilin [Caldalkalibacillus mannanilyticus]